MNAQLAFPLALPATGEESRRARDRGISQTARSNSTWLQEAMTGLRRFCADRTEITIEEFRHWWLANGGAVPTSCKAWGALGNAANRCGWLYFVGYTPAKSVKTHGHPIRIYRVQFGGGA